MPKKKQPSQVSETIVETAREEMALLLFRGLTEHQQRKKITEMRALFDANRVSHSHLAGKALRTVSDETVAAAFKHVSLLRRKKKVAKKPGRPDDAPMDDYPDPGSEKP